MEFHSINNAQPHMVKLQNRQESFLPLKSGEEALPIKKINSEDQIEIRKMKLKKAVRGFEAIFIRQLLNTMRSTIPEGAMFGKGSVSEIYGDMMDNALAETLSERSVLGLSDSLYRQLSKNFEMAEEIKPNAIKTLR
ncbi:rod-binding protein [Candidatus Latescibacterota bacterium]